MKAKLKSKRQSKELGQLNKSIKTYRKAVQLVKLFMAAFSTAGIFLLFHYLVVFLESSKKVIELYHRNPTFAEDFTVTKTELLIALLGILWIIVVVGLAFGLWGFLTILSKFIKVRFR